MDYKKIYNNLMSSRLSDKSGRKISKKQGEYYERHHIIPISLGGNKSYAIGSNNIVLLTAREHYIAHRLLWLIHRTREMGFAFHKMVFSKNAKQKRIFDSRTYESAKKAFSECQRGENNPMWGRISPFKGMKVTAEQKKSHSEKMKGRMVGELNPSKSKESREKISKALLGKSREKTRGSKNSNYGGAKLLIKCGEIVGRFERLEDMLSIVPTSIYNLRNHLRSRSCGFILNTWQVFYEDEYKKA